MSDILVAGKSGQLAQALGQVSETPIHFFGRDDHDFFDVDATARLIDQLGITTLINAAAYTAVDQAESEPDAAYHLNATLPRALAKSCKLTGTKLLHISTDYVFDGEKPVGDYYQPGDETNPINVYGRTKLDGEQAALDENEDAHIIRTSWVVSEYGKNFMTTMIKLMAEGRELKVVNDQWGTPTFAPKLAQFLLKKSHEGQILHFASEPQQTWFELAKSIKSQKGFKNTILPILSHQFPTAAKRGKNTSLRN